MPTKWSRNVYKFTVIKYFRDCYINQNCLNIRNVPPNLMNLNFVKSQWAL